MCGEKIRQFTSIFTDVSEEAIAGMQRRPLPPYVYPIPSPVPFPVYRPVVMATVTRDTRGYRGKET